MPQSRQGKDAIALLKEDHKKVKGLLSQLEKTTERGADRRKTLLGKIEEEIKAHTTIEEEIFYPAYRDAVKKKDDRELYQEALEEHHVVDLVMPEIKRTDPAGEVFGAKAKVLKELIEHHADEEEKEMFPKARKVLGAAELKDLGARMAARKRALKARALDPQGPPPRGPGMPAFTHTPYHTPSGPASRRLCVSSTSTSRPCTFTDGDRWVGRRTGRKSFFGSFTTKPASTSAWSCASTAGGSRPMPHRPILSCCFSARSTTAHETASSSGWMRKRSSNDGVATSTSAPAASVKWPLTG